MANITPTISEIALPDGVKSVTWTPVTEADTCLGVFMPGFAPIAVGTSGTFGSASIALQFSLDNASWGAATVKGGTTALAITSAVTKCPNEMASFYRPVSTGGSSSSLSVVVMFVRAIAPRSP